MLRIVVLITAFMHAPFALVAIGAARAIGLPLPGLVGSAVAVVFFLLFRLRLRSLYPDRPRPSWELRIIDEPLFIHWCAVVWTSAPVLVASVVGPAIDLLRGLPLSLPYRVAMVTYASGVLLSAFGVLVRRRWVVVRRAEIRVRGLGAELDGYKIVQLSDLHIGSLTPPSWGLAWAARANGLNADLVVVTGDLVSSGVAFHGAIAEIVGKLRGRDGVFVSMGNHDYFGDGEGLVVRLEAAGARVLRNQGMTLRRGGAELYVAGVDDTWTRRADIEKTLALRPPGAPVVLLLHDPDLFPDAAARGADIVLSGHTHGGQIAMPFLARWITLSRLGHRFHSGLYRSGSSVLYVHGGLGTTGPPVRLGVPPEIALLTLRSA